MSASPFGGQLGSPQAFAQRGSHYAKPSEVTVTELAKIVGCSKSVIYDACNSGRIEPTRTIELDNITIRLFSSRRAQHIKDVLAGNIRNVRHLNPGEITATQLAEKMGLYYQVVLSAIDNGAITPARIIGDGPKMYIFRKSDLRDIRSTLRKWLSERRAVCYLNPGEITASELAHKLGRRTNTIWRAIEKGVIKPKRTIGKKPSIYVFNESDIPDIRHALLIGYRATLQLQPGEITATQLAELVGYSDGTILNAINSGRIKPVREIGSDEYSYHIFNKADVYKIKRILDQRQYSSHMQLNPGEITSVQLAEIIGHSSSMVSAAIKRGRIKPARQILSGKRPVNIFNEANIPNIVGILDLRAPVVDLEPGEITLPKLAEKLDLSRQRVHQLIQQGILDEFVIRKIIRGQRPLFIFNESDAEEIRRFLG